MQWFVGDVGAAISEAKNKQTIFCVVITGEDETSQNLKETLKKKEVGDGFNGLVCISIEQGSNTFSQFSQIYPVLLVPSIFYVDSLSGVDIEVTVTVSDEKTILAGLERAKERFNQLKSGQAAPAVEESQPTIPNTVEESAPSTSLPKPNIEEAKEDVEARVTRARELLDDHVGSVQVSDHQTPTNLEDRVERARLLMQQRKEEREKQEADKEKEREMERRNLGKDVQELMRKQEEDKLKEMARERKREKEEERLAREKVKAAIEQDRADRAARYAAEKSAKDEEKKEKEKKRLAQEAAELERAAASRSSIARIQFRLPDGRTQTQQFSADAPLGDLYSWVTSDLSTGFSRFSLSTSFPRRNLDNEPKSSSLKDLQLAPSATVLVLPQVSTLATSDGSMMSFLMLILSPFTFIWGLISSLFNRPEPDPQQTSASAPNTNVRKEGSVVKRNGNIGRLRQGESDDENNTYNGNSTQQM